MNRERAQKLLPVIQAFAEGKDVQCRHNNGTGKWNKPAICPNFDGFADWRVVPEPRKFFVNVYEDAGDHTRYGYVYLKEEDARSAAYVGAETIEVVEVIK